MYFATLLCLPFVRPPELLLQSAMHMRWINVRIAFFSYLVIITTLFLKSLFKRHSHVWKNVSMCTTYIQDLISTTATTYLSTINFPPFVQFFHAFIFPLRSVLGYFFYFLTVNTFKSLRYNIYTVCT